MVESSLSASEHEFSGRSDFVAGVFGELFGEVFFDGDKSHLIVGDGIGRFEDFGRIGGNALLSEVLSSHFFVLLGFCRRESIVGDECLCKNFAFRRDGSFAGVFDADDS